MSTSGTYDIQIDRGCALLDRELPEWRSLVDQDKFDMKKNDSCILAQLFGDYMTGLDKLGVPRYTTDDVDCGFDIPKHKISNSEYDYLTDEWKRRLKGVTL